MEAKITAREAAEATDEVQERPDDARGESAQDADEQQTTRSRTRRAKAPARETSTDRTDTAAEQAATSERAPAKKTTRKRASKSGRTAARKAAPGAEPPAKVTTPDPLRPLAEPGERRRKIEKQAQALPVREDEEAWSPAELEEVYRELQADADRLATEINAAVTELADLIWDSGEGAGDDQADAGSKTFEREHEMSLAANARDMLAQTERAMKRIVDGTYGACEGCGNPIGKARLQAYPRATLCVSCKQREERR